MSDTIRERILTAIAAKLAEIRTTYAYTTECGQLVERASFGFDASDLPAISLLDQPEESERMYGVQKCTMPIEVHAAALFTTGNPSVLANQILGDLIACMLRVERILSFTSGGTYVIAAGNTITGHTGGATAKVIGVTVSSGSFSAGNAAGTLRFRTQTGTFQAGDLDVGTNLNVATIAGDSTQRSSSYTATAGLASDVAYTGGGVIEWPESNNQAVKVVAGFNIVYETVLGDPYTQPS